MRTKKVTAPFAPLLALLAASCGAPPAPEAPPSASLAAAPAIATAAPGPALPKPPRDAASLGQLELAITGTADCQAKVREGLLAMHSFLYDQAHETFGAALAADPSCAMAAWGDAMAHDHPIWHMRDIAKGRAALARVTREEALTPKERAFVAAARALYSKDDHDEAHRAWLAAAEAMHRDYPSDDEVALQHALATLGVYGYDKKHVREQMQAGALALAVFARRPDHPGAAHYAIHAFDSPDHAILALPAAQAYARIAPAAGHAQHMPSHTFTHLGMWREVVPSNERAYAASVAWEKAHGKPAPSASRYDWHAYAWLVAARLELGQPSEAKKLIDAARAVVLEQKDDDASGLRADYADMVADYVSQTERWGEAEALLAPVLTPVVGEGTGGDGPVACAMHAPGGGADFRMPAALFARMSAHRTRAEAAIHEGDAAMTDKRVADMKAVRAQMAAWSKAFSPDTAARQDAVFAALTTEGRAGKKAAPAAEDAAFKALEKLEHVEAGATIAGPAWRRTTRETLGEWLLARGRAKDALARFEAELAARPNRALSLLGVARAAKASGDVAKARASFQALADLWRDADADLPALAEVRAGAAGG